MRQVVSKIFTYTDDEIFSTIALEMVQILQFRIAIIDEMLNDYFYRKHYKKSFRDEWKKLWCLLNWYHQLSSMNHRKNTLISENLKNSEKRQTILCIKVYPIFEIWNQCSFMIFEWILISNLHVPVAIFNIPIKLRL